MICVYNLDVCVQLLTGEILNLLTVDCRCVLVLIFCLNLPKSLLWVENLAVLTLWLLLTLISLIIFPLVKSFP